jgi:hypothetical protein
MGCRGWTKGCLPDNGVDWQYGAATEALVDLVADQRQAFRPDAAACLEQR